MSFTLNDISVDLKDTERQAGDIGRKFNGS